MAATIRELHSITSAQGWYFDSTRDPVLCFALVSTIDPARGSNDPCKMVIGLSPFDASNEYLIGSDVTADMQNLIHERDL